jgi:isocitrate dehydrogenase kinase/phosphatase
MFSQMTDSRKANVGAQRIFDAFNAYQSQFNAITQRAGKRFEKRDWPGMQADAWERLDLYGSVAGRVTRDIEALLADRIHDKILWVSMKAVYSSLIAGNVDWDLAETFFNSITRRIFTTIGVDPQIEFVNTDFETPPTEAASAVYRSYHHDGNLAVLIAKIIDDYHLKVSFRDILGDAQRVAEKINTHMNNGQQAGQIKRLDMVTAPFYREKGAYLIGRMKVRTLFAPVVLALQHTDNGVAIDAVLLEEKQTSILFSYTRSYFHVHAPRPYDLVRFLESVIPRKRIAELYISIGHNKHGKTELFREMVRHTLVCGDQFRISRGKPGLVMVVFDMPKLDLVFKMIRDRFGYPKRTTRAKVMEMYDFVFKHERIGRLLDVQSFEHLEAKRCCFSDALLAELQKTAPSKVKITEDEVILEHVYVERRVTPLDVFLQEADDAAARKVVIDFGVAIKDMAVSNIFTGDMLLKNFGVTRHGRVVFYDYDELLPLMRCNFRKMPASRTYEDEFAAQPWFEVGENDVFPEEFNRFLGLTDSLRKVFIQHHGDLFKVDFWQECQNKIKAGEWVHILPYSDEQRLAPAP